LNPGCNRGRAPSCAPSFRAGVDIASDVARAVTELPQGIPILFTQTAARALHVENSADLTGVEPDVERGTAPADAMAGVERTDLRFLSRRGRATLESMTKLGTTGLDIFGLNLGGAVFGRTADESMSFAVLDAYAGAGGNFLDTANAYGGGGGSETIIGKWLTARGRRDDMVIATKVGAGDQRPGLSAANIAVAVEESLRRLQTDHIDLYYAHRDDLDTPQEETLAAFDGLVRAGKVRYIAASNFEPDRLASALSISDREGCARYVALQPHYNLMKRDYEKKLAPLVARENLATLPHSGLAQGFLTG
jgi:diketogulonate reductase-like aldo/keto reductase